MMQRRAFGFGLLASAARLYCQNCAPPAGGTPVAFSVPTGQTNIQRNAISALQPNEVRRLRLAYQRLRERTQAAPNDPRGWMQQANVHCFQCGGNPQGQDIHQTWFFLPWHRAYLYYHERILCRLLNDNTFRLPYWDWDLTSSRNLPPIHRPQTVDNAPNSLFNANRDVNGGQSMPAFIFPTNGNPMNAPNFRTFGGRAGAGGAIENGPHGLIHVWTAHRPVSQARPDMGRLDTAARDPIFYAHHCNIDRLWAEWLRRNPTAHRNPTSTRWLNRTFTFFDENEPSRMRRIRVRDVIDTTASLGYSYAPGAALSTPKEISQITLTIDPETSAVKLTQEAKARLSGAPASVNVNRSLVVEGADLPAATGLYFIFAGDVPATGADPSTADNYLGYFALIKGEHSHGNNESAVVLRPNARFLEMAAAAQGARLVRAPAAAEGSTLQGTLLRPSRVFLIDE